MPGEECKKLGVGGDSPVSFIFFFFFILFNHFHFGIEILAKDFIVYHHQRKGDQSMEPTRKPVAAPTATSVPLQFRL